jgi:hypothetical protein
MLADKLEQIYRQDFPQGKVMRMTNNEMIDDIVIKHTSNNYYFLELGVNKNWNFTLGEFEENVEKE